jgi:hypothetical protein
VILSGSSEMWDFYGCNDDYDFEGVMLRCVLVYVRFGILEDPHNLLIFIAYLSHATPFHINKTQFGSQM